jgi:polyhydroxyalkanoate synthesis regulator phasin
MTTIETAKTRAEELIQTVQKRARRIMNSDEGMAKAMRSLVEERNLLPQDMQRRFEDFVDHMKSNVRQLVEGLPLATKSDVHDLSKQVGALNRKLNELSKRIEGHN